MQVRSKCAFRKEQWWMEGFLFRSHGGQPETADPTDLQAHMARHVQRPKDER